MQMNRIEIATCAPNSSWLILSSSFGHPRLRDGIAGCHAAKREDTPKLSPHLDR
jgi:hypothetical protein